MRKGTKTSILAALIMAPVLTACGGTADADNHRTDTPKSLVGEWYQTNKLDNGVTFKASVYRGESIQVRLVQRDGSSSNYWMGSFQSSKSPRHDFKTTSLADPDAQKWMRNSLFGSQDSTKKFEYDDGDLSFKFTMMGTTSTIHLRKNRVYVAPTPTRTITTSPRGGYKVPSAKPTTKAPAAKAPVYKAPAPVKTTRNK